MSYVFVAPEVATAAASELAGIGAAIDTANAAAALPTTGMIAAAGDEVSTAIAAMFGQYAQAYQAISAQASTFHTQFVQAINAGAVSYAAAEAANTSPLQAIQDMALTAINAPAQSVFGRPLIGNGADATMPG
ncbi:PE family protein, partial [Mycobacterium basiliense]